MSFSEWKPVFDQAMAVYGHEPIQVRVGLALAAAFLVLMMLEGLRATFLPGRKAQMPAASPSAPDVPVPPEAPKPQAMATNVSAIAAPAPYALAPAFAPRLRPPPPRNRKRAAAAPRPHRSIRPKIRRRAAGEHGEHPAG